MAPKTKPGNVNIPGTVMTDAEPWPEVNLNDLLATHSAAPAFPMDALPEKFRAVADSIATARYLNIDLVTCSLLATASGAIGNRVRLQVTNMAAEPLALFMILVAESGDGKTEAIGLGQAVFDDIEHRGSMISMPKDPVADAIDKARNLAARQAIAREGGIVAADPANVSGGSGRRRFVLTSFTMAGLRNALAERAEGMTAVNDEIIHIMGLNSRGGADVVRARTIILKGFDGKPYQFESAAGDVFVPALQLTILGGIQPDRIPLLLGTALDGMAPRFLWCAPDVVRFNAMPESDGELPQFMAAAGRLAAMEPARLPDRFYATMPISAEARQVMMDANADWDKRGERAPRLTKSLLARSRSQALRLAGVMALTERALAGEETPGGALSGDDAERGVMLMNRYFLPMAERATTELQHQKPETPAAQLARHLVTLGKKEINARADILRGVGSPLHDADVIATALEELRLRGYVRKVPHIGLGRPASTYQVNPNLLRDK